MLKDGLDNILLLCNVQILITYLNPGRKHYKVGVLGPAINAFTQPDSYVHPGTKIVPGTWMIAVHPRHVRVITPRACARDKAIGLSVVVVVTTNIATSRDLGI